MKEVSIYLYVTQGSEVKLDPLVEEFSATVIRSKDRDAAEPLYVQVVVETLHIAEQFLAKLALTALRSEIVSLQVEFIDTVRMLSNISYDSFVETLMKSHLHQQKIVSFLKDYERLFFSDSEDSKQNKYVHKVFLARLCLSKDRQEFFGYMSQFYDMKEKSELPFLYLTDNDFAMLQTAVCTQYEINRITIS